MIDKWRAGLLLGPTNGRRGSSGAFAADPNDRAAARLSLRLLPNPPGRAAVGIVDRLPALYERGLGEGTFRADCPFEIAYGVALSALVGGAVLRARGAGSRRDASKHGVANP